MSSAPLVSVIIPTYNRWPWVGEAIDSVLRQTFADFELIVVDDGSTDETESRLAHYGTRVQVISQVKGGVSSARNRGVRASRGKYLAFLDSDDIWLPRKLEQQIAFMESHREYNICQTEEIWMRDGVRVNPRNIHRKPSGDIFRASLDLCLVSPSAAMLTRELFDRVGGFDENLPVCEDYDLWLRIAVDQEVGLLPEPLIVKRGGHADQLSHALWGMDRFRVAALQKLLRGHLPLQKRAWAFAVLQRKVRVLTQGARKRGRFAEAAEYEAMPLEFCKEPLDVGSAGAPVCPGESVSSTDA
ncbi:MAG: glycosyltransferase [Deltaproteobacteria bacterium]|nr:glycosyltransferase [Deltaproteobacteria bacterium]